MKKESIIQKKSFDFAVKIYHLSRQLVVNRQFSVADQLLRSGTSIGANVEEGHGGHSLKEFSHRISIAYKEARETRYWLKLLRATGSLSSEQAETLITEAEELCRMLGSAQKTLRAKIES
ncbi:MAG: four helix bundle protein [Bacteroidetes bacterium]|nr:MAG: four helix bundle protein [Bacteroidota bacterium]